MHLRSPARGRAHDMHDISRVLPEVASPMAKLCTSHHDASSKTRPHLEDRDSSTWQLLSEGATRLLCYSLSTGFLKGFLRDPQEVEKRIRWRKSNFDLPAVQSEDLKLFEHVHARHHGGDRENKDGGHQVAFLARVAY
jgi:hypothetical protein